MKSIEPQYAEQAAACEAAENSRYSGIIPILCEDVGERVTGPRQFTVKAPRPGAILHHLNWALAALDAFCAPVEEVTIAYGPTGEVAATVYIGDGWVHPDGFEDFLGVTQEHPRVAAFEWQLDMLPMYSYIAAKAIEYPDVFEQIGNDLRESLMARAELHIPRVRCPCDPGGGYQAERNSREAVAGILSRLRAGLLRWRGKGGAA